MKNTLLDLNNILFEQLERLNDESLSDEDMLKEIGRSKAMVVVSNTVINAGNLSLQIKKHCDEYGLDAPMQIAGTAVPSIMAIGGRK